VSRLALRFGGGGHKQASAFDTKSSWKKALKEILKAVEEDGLEERPE
jgi:nanoRNase/pAp phosphatase (c-di-AMP/oligoRNAs hydrolase)